MRRQNIKPLPVQVYFTTVLLLTFAGIAVSSYLAFSHYRVFTDIEYKSFCAISKSINCDTVSQSRFAVFAGVPVAVWGLFGYAFMLFLLIFSIDTKEKKMQLLGSLFLLSLVFCVISLCLGIISSFFIHAYCIMCIASWVVNFVLLFMFWLIRRRYENFSLFESFKKDILFWKQHACKTVFVLALVLIITGGLILFYPDYWHYDLPAGTTTLNTGKTEEGHPWIGAASPELTITEFSDYRCFQCKKMHFFLRNLVSKHADKLRLVHRHFPMDHKFNPLVKEAFHPGAGVLALIAISAAEQGRFWETNDYLFNYDLSGGAIYLREIAEDLDMDLKSLQQNMYKSSTTALLTKDIIFGLKHEFTGTPAFVIKGEVYIGQIPPGIIQSLVK